MNKNQKIKLSKIAKPFQDVKKEIIIIESLTKILLDSIRESKTFEDYSIEHIAVVLYDRVELLHKKVNTVESTLKI